MLKLKAFIAPHSYKDKFKIPASNWLLYVLSHWHAYLSEYRHGDESSSLESLCDVFFHINLTTLAWCLCIASTWEHEKESNMAFVTVAYVVLNANVKCTFQSDEALLRKDTKLSVVPPAVPYKNVNFSTLLKDKIFDDFLFTGIHHSVRFLLKPFNKRLSFKSSSAGPGIMNIYWLWIFQHGDMSSMIDRDEKLQKGTAYSITRARRALSDNTLNAVEFTEYISGSASVNWISMITSPLCSFTVVIYSSFCQMIRSVSCHSIVTSSHRSRSWIQCHDIRIHGGTVMLMLSFLFLRILAPKKIIGNSFTSFPVYQWSTTGTVIDGISFSCTFGTSHKCKRPVTSTATAEKLSVGHCNEEGENHHVCTLYDT